jgi:hypothetical protein
MVLDKRREIFVDIFLIAMKKINHPKNERFNGSRERRESLNQFIRSS